MLPQARIVLHIGAFLHPGAGQGAGGLRPQDSMQFVAAGQHQQVGIGQGEQADAATAHGLPEANGVRVLT